MQNYMIPDFGYMRAYSCLCHWWVPYRIVLFDCIFLNNGCYLAVPSSSLHNMRQTILGYIPVTQNNLWSDLNVQDRSDGKGILSFKFNPHLVKYLYLSFTVLLSLHLSLFLSLSLSLSLSLFSCLSFSRVCLDTVTHTLSLIHSHTYNICTLQYQSASLEIDLAKRN